VYSLTALADPLPDISLMTQPITTAARSNGAWRRPGGAPAAAVIGFVVLLLGAAGCATGPRVLTSDERHPIDRKLVEGPPGFDLEVYAVGLSGPVAMTFDGDGNLIVAEGGFDGSEPRIYGFTPDLKRFEVYPLDKSILPFGPRKFRLYGPIGDVLFHKGSIYVSHRDENDLGVITALDYKGGHRTIVAGLPAQGEHGVTGMAIDPRSGRLYFGIGSATNSGVVGLDDYAMGWVKDHPEVHDVPYTPDVELTLWGRRMNSANPLALWFMPDIAVTAPFQAFASSNKTRIKGATRDNPKCNSAILSCQPEGGDLRVDAYGYRLPRGLRFNEYGLYFTNQGMEARGTRPVNNDPDSFCRQFPRSFGGFPDFTTHLQPVTEPQFQPPQEMIIGSGYPDVSFLVNHEASGLRGAQSIAASAADVVKGVFPSQSGAWGFDFAPAAGPFRDYAGNAIVALFGDRAPYATGGQKLIGPVGFKIVRVEWDKGQVREFVRNVRPGPASRLGGDAAQLERPIDVKFGPDGAMYILDFGRMQVKDGRFDVTGGTGRIYRLIPSRVGQQATP
jgi:glucose/arabinose dehydrogenase